MAEAKFEKDLEKLEAIVEALEEGGLPLDEALKKFEQGIGLAKRCEKALSQAEKKIELLTKNAGGELETEAFESDGAEEAPQKNASASAKEKAGTADAADDEDDDDDEEDEDDDQSELF